MLISALIKILGLILFLASQVLYADTPKMHHTSLDAHVHGLSELTLAMEGNTLEIQLKSPAMNLLGFEHKARTKNDFIAVENAVALLGKSDSLFSFSGGRCHLTNSSVDVSGVSDSGLDVHANEAEAHDHEHEDSFSERESHSEIIASYDYRCESLATLSSMTVALFDVFPGIHQVHALWVTEKQQGGKTLDAKNRIILIE